MTRLYIGALFIGKKFFSFADGFKNVYVYEYAECFFFFVIYVNIFCTHSGVYLVHYTIRCVTGCVYLCSPLLLYTLCIHFCVVIVVCLFLCVCVESQVIQPVSPDYISPSVIMKASFPTDVV